MSELMTAPVGAQQDHGIPGTSFASRRFHFVGIGGAGVSGLARLLHGLGADISGSDSSDGALFRSLRDDGCHLWLGCAPEAIVGEVGYVIRSAAVPLSDPELQECMRRGFTPLLYAEAVGRLSEGRRTLAIAGTHGKTTTTGLTVAGLRAAGHDPSHLIGGEIPELGGNGRGGSGAEFVVEACEFNRSFHNLQPQCAAILNVDHDHFDCYPSEAELCEAFAGYLARVRPSGAALVNESVPKPVLASLRSDVQFLSVGSGLWADIRAVELRDDLGRFSFVPILLGKRLPRVQLSIPGQHNVHNALFALGLAHLAGANAELACDGVGKFGGVRRRFEVHQGPKGGVVVNDYAHHPAEIRAVLHAARRRYPGRRLVVAFQPHQHERTMRLLPEFAAALAEGDLTLLVNIYGARESAEMRAAISAADLAAAVCQAGGQAHAIGGVDEVVPVCATLLQPDDVLLLLGAGDIDRAVGGLRELR